MPSRFAFLDSAGLIRLGWVSAVLVSLLMVTPESGNAETIRLNPVRECQWSLAGRDTNPNASCPSVDTRQGSRSALVFDLAGVDPDSVVSMVLELVPVQTAETALLHIEAIGLSSIVPLDPFVYSLQAPDSGPCTSASCPVAQVWNSDRSDGKFLFMSPFATFDPIPTDVSAAISALGAGAEFLQIDLVPRRNVEEPGLQFGHSGFSDPRLAPAVLEITVVPEPATGMLVLFSLVGIAIRRRSCSQAGRYH